MYIDHWFKCLKEKQTLVFIIMFFVRDIELGSQILWLCITRFFVRYRASWKIVENPSRPYSWKQVIDTAKKGSVLQAHRLFGKVSNSKILIQTFAKFDCSQSSSIGCNLFLPQITPATPLPLPHHSHDSTASCFLGNLLSCNILQNQMASVCGCQDAFPSPALSISPEPSPMPSLGPILQAHTSGSGSSKGFSD